MEEPASVLEDVQHRLAGQLLDKQSQDFGVNLQNNLGYVPPNGGPNQIGNVEDGPIVSDMEPELN